MNLMLRIYENQVKTSLSSCVHTCTDLGTGSGRKGITEKLLLKWGKFSFYVIVDCEIANFRS